MRGSLCTNRRLRCKLPSRLRRDQMSNGGAAAFSPGYTSLWERREKCEVEETDNTRDK